MAKLIKSWQGYSLKGISYGLDNLYRETEEELKAEIRQRAKEKRIPFASREEIMAALGSDVFNEPRRKSPPNRGRRRVSKDTMIIASRKLKLICAAINYATTSGIEIGKYISAQDIATYLGAYVYNNRRYNSWTGNLSNSYRVTVVNNRKITHSEYYPAHKMGNKVSDRVYKLLDRKHKVFNATFKDGSYIRYIHGKGWLRKISDTEKENGYQTKRGANNHFSFLGIGQAQAKTGVIVENTAPYADQVQQRGYTVLANARAMRDFKTHTTKLVAMAINKQLKSFGQYITVK